MTITMEDMRDKMTTVEDLRTELAATEPLRHEEFEAGASIHFELSEDTWGFDEAPRDTDRVDALVTIGNAEFGLTREALLEATSICGIPKGYVLRTPPELIQSHVNYWFGAGLQTKKGEPRRFKGLAVGDDASPAIAAFTNASVTPFSNLELLDQIIAAAGEKYGATEETMLVDYKKRHSLGMTEYRLIVPEHQRQINSARHAAGNEDNWSTGIQVRNSLIGLKPTALDGYLFAYWCTNGCTDTFATSGNWQRRGTGGNDVDSVYEWAYSSVGTILEELETSLDRVEALTQQPVNGDVSVIIGDLFRRYAIPNSLRVGVMEALADNADQTMYGILQAITWAANQPGITEQQRTQLLEFSGNLPREYGSGRVAFESLDAGHTELSGQVEVTLPDGSVIPTQVKKVPDYN